MAKKRGNSEGTIHKLPSGSWRAQVSLEGRRLSHTSKTRQEAQQWIKEISRQIDGGLRSASLDIMVTDYMDEWLNGIKVTNQKNSSAQYEQITRDYINPYIGSKRLRDLRTNDVQNLYNKLAGDGIGVYAISKVHTVLHSALQQAVKAGMLHQNPATNAKPPKKPAHEMRVLTENQVRQLLISAQGHRWEALFHLAVVTGMRQMELLGLKWSDLDWEKGVIRVERQLSRDSHSGATFASPKTNFGKRAVILGEKTLDLLRAHREKQQVLAGDAGEKWIDYGLIFTTSWGTPINHRNLTREYKNLLRLAGLPDIRFHDLRHTAASLMLNNNVAPIVVSRRLGHAKASITLDIYGHLIPGMQEEAARKMDNLVTPIPIQPSAPQPAINTKIL